MTDSYQKWIETVEAPTIDLERFKKVIGSFRILPKISIIVPVYNIERSLLDLMITSAVDQIYPYWELCLADDASPNPQVKTALYAWQSKDERIKVSFLEQNRGISGASNAALEMATGEYIALLDHDDLLSPQALYEVVKLIITQPDADFIYTDEDKIDSNGRRCDPSFKPDWSPDMINSIMYTCHLGVYRKRLVDEIGGFRSECDGSQDHDLVLRLIENTHNIHHIPKILYHWRKIEGSAATSTDAKSYAFTAAKRALTDMLDRKNIRGHAEDGSFLGGFRVRYELTRSPHVTIIILSQSPDYLSECLNQLLSKSTYPDFDVLVVDRRIKSDGIKSVCNALSEQHGHINYLRLNRFGLRNKHYGGITNKAVKRAKGEYIILLNEELLINTPCWIESLLEHCQRSEVGVTGCKLLFANNTIQHAGLVIAEDGSIKFAFQQCINDMFHFMGKVDRNYSGVTSACMMFKKSSFQMVRGFAKKELSPDATSADFCLNLQTKGYRTVYTPHAELSWIGEIPAVTHNLIDKDRNFMKKKWPAQVRSDPFWSSHLSRKKPDFSINGFEETQIQIYYDTGNGFNESDSFIRLIYLNNLPRSFFVPLPSKTVQLRIDPCNCAAHGEITYFAIYFFDPIQKDADGESSAWEDKIAHEEYASELKLMMKPPISTHDLAETKYVGDKIAFEAIGNDPHFVFNVQNPLDKDGLLSLTLKLKL